MPKKLLVIDVLVTGLTMDDPSKFGPKGLTIEVATTGAPYEPNGASPEEIAILLMETVGPKVMTMTLTEKGPRSA